MIRKKTRRKYPDVFEDIKTKHYGYNNHKIVKNFNIGDPFIAMLGYPHILLFHFFDQITKTQTLKVRFDLWDGYNKITGISLPSIYIPFNTEGISHKIIKGKLIS